MERHDNYWNKELKLCKPCNKALSFCRSKIILDRPNYFRRVQIVLDVSKLFWLVQIKLDTSTIILYQSKMKYKRTRHKFFAKEDGENNLVISLQFPVSTFKEDLQGCILHLHYLREVHGLCQAEWIFFKAHASCLVPTRIMFYKQQFLVKFLKKISNRTSLFWKLKQHHENY